MLLRPLRLLAVLGHVLWGLALAGGLALGLNRQDPQQLGQRWARRLLRLMGIKLKVYGAPQPGGQLLVANHVSWLDIFVILASQPTRFVAKSEISDWPVAGWLADAMGTFYIRRGRGGARPLIERLTPHLRDGGTVVVFPEGTTTDGHGLSPFHARLFGAAVDAEVPVQPLALRYGPASDGSHIAPFIGDDDLLSHLFRLLREPHLTVTLRYCSPLPAPAQDRDTLASQAEDAIRTSLALADSTPSAVWPAALTA